MVKHTHRFKLLDSAGAAVLVGAGSGVAMTPVVIGHVDACGRVPTAVADADDDAPLLKTFADGVGGATVERNGFEGKSILVGLRRDSVVDRKTCFYKTTHWNKTV